MKPKICITSSATDVTIISLSDLLLGAVETLNMTDLQATNRRSSLATFCTVDNIADLPYSYILNTENAHKFLVFGYIRRISKAYQSLIIPEGVSQICLTFYSIHDYFACHGDKIMVNEARNIASATTDYSHPNTVYGNEIIDPNDHLIKAYKWTFRVHSEKDGRFSVGINDINNKFQNTASLTYEYPLLFFDCPGAYGMHFGRYDWQIVELYVIKQKYKRENKKYGTVDYFYMHLLKMRRDGVYLGEYRIDINKKYNVGFIMDEKQQKCELVRFKQIMENGEKRVKDEMPVENDGYIDRATKFLKSLF